MAEDRRKEEDERRESGEPGGGKGRRDEVGRSGVYPVSSLNQAPQDAQVRGEQEWGQGERGASGYQDSGRSGLEAFWREEKEKDILEGDRGEAERREQRPEEEEDQ